MKKLTVKRTTIRPLTSTQLDRIVGGVPTSMGTCLCTGTQCVSNTGQCDSYCICSYAGCTTLMTTTC